MDWNWQPPTLYLWCRFPAENPSSVWVTGEACSLKILMRLICGGIDNSVRGNWDSLSKRGWEVMEQTK